GWPAPTKQGTETAHGAALGATEIAATKELLGFDPSKSFDVAPEVIAHTRELRTRGAAARRQWQTGFDAWSAANPQHRELFDRLEAGELPEGFEAALPVWPLGESIATR